MVIEQLPTLHALRLPLLDPWAAADTIIDNGQRPNYAFRMGLSDTLAIDALLGEIERRKLRRIGLLAPQTAWGRSCQYAAERYIASRARQRLEIVGIEWHRWGAHDSIPGSYRTLLELGADALLLIAKEPEGAALVKGLAGMPAQALRPIFSHWGISGGRIPGTGLGLSLVKEIMKLHGGSVSLESTPDAGTCATLWFPVTAQQGTALARSRAGL